MNIHTNIHTHTYTNTHTHTNTHTYTHKHTHTNTHTYTHIYIVRINLKHLDVFIEFFDVAVDLKISSVFKELKLFLANFCKIAYYIVKYASNPVYL